MVLQPIQKPTWQTGLRKRIRAIPLKQRYDLIFVAVLAVLQISLVIFGFISASQ